MPGISNCEFSRHPVEVLLKNKIHPKIIEVKSKIYMGDTTNIKLNGKIYATTEITSGIRQGCNGSALLFIMVTYVIIDEIQKFDKGYKDEYTY